VPPRHRLTANPDLWPTAVEEFMRLYPLVYQDGRLVKQDINFHGLELKKATWCGSGSPRPATTRRSSPTR
jgi:cytochrome P450